MSGKMGLVVVAFVVSVLVLCGMAQPVLASHEAFGLYENWSTSSFIRADRWRGSDAGGGQEVKREIGLVAGPRGRRVALMRLRRQGQTDSNVGRVDAHNSLEVTHPLDVDQMAADFVVRYVTLTSCAANVTPSKARVELVIEAFNDGSSSGPGDRRGDVLGAIQAVHRATDPEPLPTLRVEAAVSRCLNSDCSTFEDLFVAGSNGLIGVVQVGAPFTLQLIWDEPNHRFFAGVNTTPLVEMPYTASLNVAPATVPLRVISVRNGTANCTAGPTQVDVETEVRNVRTNTSAIVP